MGHHVPLDEDVALGVGEEHGEYHLPCPSPADLCQAIPSDLSGARVCVGCGGGEEEVQASICGGGLATPS